MIYVEKNEATDLFIPRGASITCDCEGGGCAGYDKGYEDGYAAGYEAAQAKSVNLTQEEYDNLEEKPCNTYFNIIEED